MEENGPVFRSGGKSDKPRLVLNHDSIYAQIQLDVQISIRKENIKHIIDLKRWWYWAKINSPSTLSARSAVTIALGIPDQRTSHQFLQIANSAQTEY